ncbi:MAG TPA: nucleotide disphospho-sugar-binding domain-containing protein [Streptosporangiaceae bacterium]|nr:nucleotide disphospho-sugar-binding domain-containing protein [Streptosporangiaceae bacterium]
MSGAGRRRFLFVVPPLAGHVNPASAVAWELAQRGHEVAWAGSRSRLAAMLGPDATVYQTGMRLHRGLSDTGTAAVKSLWEGFIVPFARFTLPGVDKAVHEYQPDVLAVDQAALSGALVAQRHNLPWASMCASTMELGHPLAALPKVDAWVRGHMTALRAEAGLPPDGDADLRFSPHLVIAFTGAALAGDSFPPHFALVGASVGPRPASPAFQWDFLDRARRAVLVTVGTLAETIATGPADFYTRAVEALLPLGERVQGIVVAPEGMFSGLPEHILMAPRVPLLDLLPHMAAVVSHGGLNTVSEAMAAGVPLVVAPIRHDQPINAAQVAAAGAGIRVKFGRVSPAELRAALLSVLDDPSYRAAARRASESYLAAGGAKTAADHLERLAM